MTHYIALIHKDAGSDFGVSFPDFPGCISTGTSEEEALDEARAMAEEALALHIESMAENGEPIPEPSSLEAIMADPENRDGVATLISVKTSASRSVRVNVTFPEDVLEEIDSYAEGHGYTRSGFLLLAAKREMERR